MRFAIGYLGTVSTLVNGEDHDYDNSLAREYTSRATAAAADYSRFISSSEVIRREAATQLSKTIATYDTVDTSI